MQNLLKLSLMVGLLGLGTAVYAEDAEDAVTVKKVAKVKNTAKKAQDVTKSQDAVKGQNALPVQDVVKAQDGLRPQDAANQEKGIYIGASYTQWTAENNGDSADKSGATLKLGYDFNQNWAIEARANLMQYKETDKSASFKMSTPFALYGKYRYPVTSKFAPYAVVGVAFNRFNNSYKDQYESYEESSSGLNLSAGIGVEFSLTPSLKATAEYVYLGKVKQNFEEDNLRYRASSISAGLQYRF